MSFFGADTDELQEAGQKCQEGAETTDQVIQYLRALVIALRAASFFTGGASAAYAEYLSTTVIPWLERISAALKLFAQVLLAHAKAQNDASDGRTVDYGSLPTYSTPQLPAGNTADYPAIVAPNCGVPGAVPDAGPNGGAGIAPVTGGNAPVGVAPGGSSSAGISPTSVAPAGGIGGQISTPTGVHGLGQVQPGSSSHGSASHGSVPQGIASPGSVPQGDLSGAAGSPSGGAGGGTSGAPLGTAAGPGGVPEATTDTSSGTPSSRAFGSLSGVDAMPVETSPVSTAQNGMGGGFGTAAAIAGGAAALGLGGAAMARRNGRTGSPDLESLVAANGRGSRGDDVRALQEQLTAAGYDTRGVDGQWGGRTQAAYEAWRADNPLEVRHGSGYTSPDGFDYTSVAGVQGNAHVTPEFLREMEGVAQRVGARPEDLMAVMALESDRTFAPGVQNPDTRATGLIQFMPRTAEGLGTSTEELSRMTAVEQLPYVEKYLMERRGHVGNLESLYTSILYGSPREDPASTLWSRGSAEYGANSGLDRNRDGRITAGEAADSVRTFIRN